jgi:hypothetical protein
LFLVKPKRDDNLFSLLNGSPFPAQKYEKLYESLIPLKMESLEEILITSDGEEEQEQEQTSLVQSAEPCATSPSPCNGHSSSSPLNEMSSLPAEPVFQCPLDNCNFIIAQEVRPSRKILFVLISNSPGAPSLYLLYK